MEDISDTLEAQYVSILKRHAKKLQGLPKPMMILQRRTLNTALDVLHQIDGIAFDELSMSLYFYTADVEMAQFTRSYESQIELAAINPEKFALGLHKFLNEQSIKIRKGNLYDQFFELFYRCVRSSSDTAKKVNRAVIIAYLSLLCQQAEYLKPDKFDYTVSLGGRATTGEILTIRDAFSNFDFPGYEAQDLLKQGKKLTVPLMVSLYGKYGYPIRDLEDLALLSEKAKFQSSATLSMLPFINEYTFDILPQTPFSINAGFLYDINVDESHIQELTQALKRRKHTLPSNGVKIDFADNPVIDSLLMKEILYDDRIFMLYRYSCVEGDLCGYYDTRDSYFYSKVAEKPEAVFLAVRLTELVLYCYASYVLSNPLYQLSKIDDYFTLERDYKLAPTGYLQGGKLKNTYSPNEDSGFRTGTARIGNDDYEREERAVQGYIRKLPKNQTASAEARAFAESLGYDLNTDETYVRPFIKQVFRLRDKDESD